MLAPSEKMDVLRSRNISFVGAGVGATFAQLRVDADAHAPKDKRILRANGISLDGSTTPRKLVKAMSNVNEAGPV